MPERLLTYLHENWLVAVSMPFYTVLILLEVLFSSYQHRAYYSLGETLINFWLNIANALLGLLCKVAVLAMLYQVSQFAPMVLPAGPVYWILLFFGVDFFFYWEHRFEHESRILWAVHVTHHSSPEYNLTTGFRSSVFRPFVSCWFWVPLALLGF